jgi:uncharacterized protein
MKLNRRRRLEGELQVVVIGCSDDFCAPHHAVREYLIEKGIVKDILESNIHPIRVPGGIFTGDVIYPNDRERALNATADQIEQIRWLVKGKGATMVFPTGHNLCLGCNSVGIGIEAQKTRLIARSIELAADLGLETVTLLEEHEHGNHHEVLLEIPAREKPDLEEAA